MAGGPVDYDLVKLDIAPKEIGETSLALRRHAQDVADSIDRISAIVNALVLDGWQGASEQEAKDFGNRWLSVMTSLFGSKDHPKDGVLNALLDGVDIAAENFGKAESGVVEVFKNFAASLAGAGEGHSNGPPHDQLDPNKTAITADY